MKTEPIEPAVIEFDGHGVAHAPAFGDVYHAAQGALGQARHVFLGGNALPGRWAGRDAFVILETGFGLGNNFLATWQAWRSDPRRCDRLVYIGVEKHPPRLADLQRAPRDAPLAALAETLGAAWPPLTPNLHTLDFEAGRIRLLLAFGDVRSMLREVVAEVDAFYLDGFSPRVDAAMWSAGVFKSIARLAAPGATAATWSVAREVRDGLASAGFGVERAEGFGAKHQMTVARHAPRHRAAAPAGGLHRHDGPREALVVGAGLAGCAAAWALAREGWQVTVVDRADAPARGASGNAMGLVHGVAHGDDGTHARAHRAAALRAAQVLAPWLATGRVRGQLDGLLRLDRASTPGDAAEAAEAARVRAAAFAAGHAAWCDRATARERSGLPVAAGGWWFAQGGWVAPADLARAMLEDSGARFIGHFDVGRIERQGARWQVHGAAGSAANGQSLDAPVLVLATAERLLGRLLGRHDAPLAQALGPLASVRGQISALPVEAFRAHRLPRVPVSGDGYLAPPQDGLLWFGATSDECDLDGSLRIADHRRNLDRLASLIGAPDIASQDDATLAAMPGRVAWRAVAPDRLPWVGALPDLAACQRAIDAGQRIDAPRFVPRLRDADGGLYVIGAFASRGIGWAALCSELLASWVSGAPSPIEADLRDALDPARGWLRSRRAPPLG